MNYVIVLSVVSGAGEIRMSGLMYLQYDFSIIYRHRANYQTPAAMTALC
jgi:hypothetical protein